MYGVIATLPSATSTLSSVGEWSSPIFTEFWPFAMLAIGVFLGFWLLSWIIGHFKNH